VLYGINSPDFFEKSLFSTFISSLRESGAVNAELCPGAAFSDLETTAARTLDTDVRYNIDQAIENYFDNP
jgi:glycerol-3-phosphate O-acyltransferase